MQFLSQRTLLHICHSLQILHTLSYLRVFWFCTLKEKKINKYSKKNKQNHISCKSLCEWFTSNSINVFLVNNYILMLALDSKLSKSRFRCRNTNMETIKGSFLHIQKNIYNVFKAIATHMLLSFFHVVKKNKSFFSKDMFRCWLPT